MLQRTRHLLLELAAQTRDTRRANLLREASKLNGAGAHLLMQKLVNLEDFNEAFMRNRVEAETILQTWKFRYVCGERKVLTLSVNGEHSGVLPEWFGAKIDAADEIHLEILEGNGGDVAEVMRALEILVASGKWRSSRVIRHALSASAILASLAPFRTMNAGAMLMMHECRVVAYGDATALRSAADRLEGVQHAIEHLLEARGVDPVAVHLFLQGGRDTTLTPRQAVALGLCDEISDCR